MSTFHTPSPGTPESNSASNQKRGRVSPSIPLNPSGNLQERLNSSKVDSKLTFHIRKIVSAFEQNQKSNSSPYKSITLDYLVETLRKNHREYKRRHPNLVKFRIVVKTAFDSIVDKDRISANQVDSSNNINQKRKRKWNEEENEEKFEQEAIQIEANLEAAEKTGEYRGGSMLNSSLRQQYTKQNNKIEQGRSAVAEGEDDKSHQNSPPAVVEEGTVPTSSVKKKKKKRVLSSSSSMAKGDTGSSLNLTPIVPKERYADLGGMDRILTQIRELIEYPLLHPELFRHLGVDPPRGVLLRGPPGVGKTHLANAVAGEVGVNFFSISAPEIIGGVSGESEARVRELFQTAATSSPALIFIDEIDAIAPKRGEGKSGGSANSMEKRIVAQLLTCMDSLAKTKSESVSSHVMVIGATNRPDAIDAALRRAGRFDREICLGVPDEKAREGILRKMASGMRLSGDFDYKVVAKKTPGFVGADMRSLTKEAAVIAINRIFKTVLVPEEDFDKMGRIEKDDKLAQRKEGELTDGNDQVLETGNDEYSNAVKTKVVKPLTEEQLSPLYVTMEDFLAAISSVQPSSKREGFATVPDVTWDNIGALNVIRDELTLSVLEPIRHPERFQQLGLPLPAGVMLYGPPGCGKTLLAKAISNESGANFISVKGPELLDKYVGESERAVRQVFERARSSSPCVVFFDELDSLCPKRGADSSGGGVSERVVNQLLTEMDGLESRSSVFVIAATNRPELIDPAMLRPGRLDKLLYVPLPTPEDRVSILQAIGSKVKLAPDVNLSFIAKNARANGFSGADCAALLREAGLAVLRDCQGENHDSPLPLEITNAHFDYAFDHVMPSVSKKDQIKYDRMRDKMARARTRGCALDESTSNDGVKTKSEGPPTNGEQNNMGS